MATTAFICDVEDSTESVRSLKLKQQVCSYTLLQVLVGVLAVLVLAVTGGIVWMNLSQHCPERVWTVRFKGNDTDFTSPGSGKYLIHGMVFMKRNSSDPNCKKIFRLQTPSDSMIMINNVNEEFVKNVTLEKGIGLRIELNCIDMEIDEAKSILKVYQTDLDENTSKLSPVSGRRE